MRIGMFFAVAAAFAAAATAGAAQAPAPRGIGIGSLESRFLAVPTAAGARDTSRAANARAHYAGTPGDYAFALDVRDRLRAAGFSAKLEAFTGPIDTPRTLALSLLDARGRASRAFDLREGPVAGDADGTRVDAGIPFNYGSGSGDVRARLIVAGRGLDADYTALTKTHAVVAGAIAIVRYGAEFRGLLAERAQRHGAAGAIFYSDPRDDRMRPATSVQRGMVSDAGLRIPTLPVTYRTAQVLLSAAQRGERARLHVAMTRRIGTMWNSVGVMRGGSDRYVVLGGHRDAWVYGVTDNGSGIATLLEVAKSFGALARSGWRPARTIVIAGFDAEEIGDLGSQAFVRRHRDQMARTVAYVNADEVVTGSQFFDDAAAAIGDLVTRSARDLHIARVPATAPVPGGGSDHESFLFAPGPGVASAEAGYGGHLPTYHSAYDDLHEADAIDPGFVLHRAEARIVGLIALRLSETPHPYRFTGYIRQLRVARAGLSHGAALESRDAELELARLDAAIGRFATAARAIDRAPQDCPLSSVIGATQRLDRTLYGATGYGDLSFPAIRSALDDGKTAAVTDALASTTRAIDAVTTLLAPSSS